MNSSDKTKGEGNMTDTLKLKLNGNVVEIGYDDNGRYSLNDLFRAGTTNQNKRPSQFLRSHKVKVLKTWVESDTVHRSTMSEKDFDTYVVQTKMNRATVTYAPLELVYKYATYISKEFEDAVYAAFTELSKGNVQEAASIAESVAVPPELISKYNKTRTRLNEVVKEVYESDPHALSNFNRLAVKAATGYSPSVLHGKKSSSLEYMVEKEHPEAIQATIATMQLMITLMLMPYPISYQDIATALHVETSKNKERLSKLGI